MSDLKRLDVAMTLRGLVPSRNKASALIEAGSVTVNDKCCRKCSFLVDETDCIQVTETPRFVGRGGEKLYRALEVFAIGLNGRVCMDVGASTGGFTDCMLQHGAQKVYAIDVGTDQLAESLRNDHRVVNMEQCNFRYLSHEEIADKIDFASVDVSFISLEKILPNLSHLLCYTNPTEWPEAVCLIKPQFEAGKENLGKHGVVRNKSVHHQVIRQVMNWCQQNGFAVMGLTHSPVKGSQGNIEYLVHLQMNAPQRLDFDTPEFINQVVENAHKELGDKD